MNRQYVYVVEMCRWASCENHSYVSGVYTSLKAALKEGITHAEYRARKYEPKITMYSLDDRRAVFNTICSTLEEAQFIAAEFKRSPKKPKTEGSQNG